MESKPNLDEEINEILPPTLRRGQDDQSGTTAKNTATGHNDMRQMTTMGRTIENNSFAVINGEIT